ncbi:MAG: type II toxin-antitoxin system HicB family antitoxin [Anaerolineae bacterium]|nr:type II toxin-antitoxin system HicB family antitoxin [Anaerolineae bacterium]
MKYKVALYPSEEGFAVSCPALPGCWSQGDSEEEALANIQDAIQDYLAAIEDLLKSDQAAQVREVEIAA